MSLSDKAIADFQQKILDRYTAHKRDLPWRDTDDPYEVLVSEVMLQQTQVDRVVPKFLAFLEELPDIDALADVEKRDLLRLWSGLGFNSRALRLQQSAQKVRSEFGGQVPRSREELLTLPGIGPYSSASILAFAFNQPAPVVDTNIRRVLIHELELDENIDKSELEEIALSVIPAGRSNDWHNALMDYGSLVATSQETGIKPLSKQSTFAGSVRQARGRIVKFLIEQGEASVKEIEQTVDHTKTSEALRTLVDEGVVTQQDDTIVLK